MINSSYIGRYDKYPEKKIEGHPAFEGWSSICAHLLAECKDGVIVAELYPGVDINEVERQLSALGGKMFFAEACMMSEAAYAEFIKPYLTDDRVFGKMNTLRLEDVYCKEKLSDMQKEIADGSGLRIVYGTGASLVANADLLVYFDMSRWELQCRFKNGASNWHSNNSSEDKLKKYKQGFFIDWRMADRRKRALLGRLDYIVDTVVPGSPKMVCGAGFRKGLEAFASEPFRLMPYFAPEVWGGQWMKDVCGLPRDAENYAWAFDGVPEENSILMRFGDVRLELPSVNIVFWRPKQLLGDKVHARFGDEFPIRFDFLDTMGGQNLSLQVHPLTEYIQNTFGMHYTQDESYYILDCDKNAKVYLGLKEDINKAQMLAELKAAQDNGERFHAENYVNEWSAKKHDHFLIPAGTVHCSGQNTMVLEISATPYIFTFKLWDWERTGLDGKPRPVHLQHGEQVIQWGRTTEWVKENLINRFETLQMEDGYKEERTGLHEREFIETRRYTLSNRQCFNSEDSVSVCNVVDGEGAIVSSPSGAFAPFEVHYAETFIIPASSGSFELQPLGSECMVIRATVR